jgi:hypothetical protein
LKPKGVVLYGEDAIMASQIAARQSAVVYPEEIKEGIEIVEMVTTGAIAAFPGASTSAAMSGMPDRGGHGRIDALGIKRGKRGGTGVDVSMRPKPRKGKRGKPKDTSNILKGFSGKDKMTQMGTCARSGYKSNFKG